MISSMLVFAFSRLPCVELPIAPGEGCCILAFIMAVMELLAPRCCIELILLASWWELPRRAALPLAVETFVFEEAPVAFYFFIRLPRGWDEDICFCFCGRG